MPETQPKVTKLLADFRGLGRVWPYLRRDRKLMVAAIALIPVISGLAMLLPLVLKQTIDHGIQEKNYNYIMWGAAVYFAVAVLDYLARGSQTLLTALAVHRMIRNMRTTIVRHILDLSARFHDKSMSGALVTRATSDFDNLSESLNQGVLTSVVDLFILVGALAGIFILNWKLALATVLILPVVILIVTLFSKALKKTMLAARVKIAALNAFTQECIYGVTTVKLLAAEAAAARRFRRLADEYRNQQMHSVVIDALMFALLDGIASVTMGVVLWVAITRFTGNQELTAGVLVAFVAYIQNLFEPLKALGNKMAMLQGAFTSMDRIFGILETNDFITGKERVPDLNGAITFDNVRFRYDRDLSNGHVLRGVSFNVPAGQSLAIVGATGAGKSTIIKLISKLYDGYEGNITLDDRELANFDGHALRQQMAIVPQDIVLFEGSIAFNIAMGDESILLSRVKEACELVGAQRFIERLPGQYDFKLDEQGSNLSYGQRQLIAFARALAKHPKVVILDEATSSVDPKAEVEIQNAIGSIMKGRTVIVIAHRLSTIRQCDQIILLEGGKVVEQGNHKELLAKEGAYFRLYTALLHDHHQPLQTAAGPTVAQPSYTE